MGHARLAALGIWDMRVWQPVAWTVALRATGSSSWAVRRSKRECDAICAAQAGWCVWAFDLGQRDGATNQPKAFIAAATDVFLAAYALLPQEHRHAYEIVDGPCHVFFDLECEGEMREQGDAAAQAVERAAREIVEELTTALCTRQVGASGYSSGVVALLGPESESRVRVRSPSSI